VVTRTEGSDELVRDGQNGRVVDRDAEAIAAVLEQLAQAPEARTAMGARAREMAEPYAWSNVGDAYAAVLA
jgi:glycosyltransferase involved in cell wall biosynthesis